MSHQKVVLLDGRGVGDDDLSPVLETLMDELRSSGATVQTFPLKDIKMGSCIGCFSCWIKTPGLCVEPDAGRDIVQAIVQSDVTILFTPVTFGGYSSEIKKIQDRWIPLVLPDFCIHHGEVHHLPRYSHYPRLVGIGIQRQPNDMEANLFNVLVGRNALNFHAPTYAAEVILSTDRSDRVRQQLQKVLIRKDPFPVKKVVKSLMPMAESTTMTVPVMATPGRALLIVGSPRVKSSSSSGILGGYVLEQLKQRGWETESLTLRGHLLKGVGQAKFLTTVDQADLILFAFPLYIDSLPFLMMRSLEVMAKHLSAHSQESPKRLFAIANNGFPEAHHNALALAICQQFALDTNMVWLGGLAVGAGTVVCQNPPVEGLRQAGRPPMKHGIQALDIVSASLAEGQSVPPKAAKLMAKTPIPLMLFSLWRWLFVTMAKWGWRRGAAINQVGAKDLLAQPYGTV
ncbi:nadph-dependent fmn reductase [Leptolyngbya sp. Heron Island J]|uniref:NAD(P)H-dependent oxidoreductase n=1 Tax=Leptolyngbya sp. Heron Island J TaxID=1385935 RepID=UPI0003B95380|nr:NAD(P)H-dependent oxidoreductase [Leptolyngbya sp. Heron Island J]ESA33628.1 nadph-dependent fmn reductase [Leptolyngbya sp. Heron Island J]